MLKKVLLIAIVSNFLALGALGALVFLDNQEQKLISQEHPSEAISLDDFLDRKIAFLTNKEKKGELFMVSIPGPTLDKDTERFLTDNHIGGVILFSKNVATPEQLKTLTDDLKTKVNTRILIAIDQEGGKVSRIPWDEYSDFGARELGQKDDLNLIAEITKHRSRILQEAGINLILAPVCDIADENSIMYERSFSSSPEAMSQIIEQIVKTQQEEKMITSLKHFPGHGRTSIDSHEEFPIIDLSLEELNSHEFRPFKVGIDSGAEIIMLGHIISPQIDKKNPASISYKYVEILEGDLGFEGIVITDDLNMAGGIERTIGWGINLTVESQDKILQRMQSVEPQDKYVRKILELKYEKL